MMKIFRYCLIILLTCISAGCSLFSPVKNDQIRHLITQPYIPIVKKGSTSTSILVTQPETMAAYNTTDMAYSIKPYQLAYFSQNLWAESPSKMFHPLIVQALENTAHFHAVVTPPFVGQYDYLLNTQILMLQQDFTHRPPLLKLIARAQLIKSSTNRAIATKRFILAEPMHQISPYAGVLAANRATAIFLDQLADFCIENTTSHSPYRAGEG